MAAEITASFPPARFAAAKRLSPLEVEVVDLFVGVLRLLGLPKSLGEVYGLLFLSAEPLSLEDMADRLQLSRGALTQGVKTLRQIGAVKLVPTVGRRDHYVAETELKKLALGFMNGQMLPHLETGRSRLQRLRELESQELGGKKPDAAAVHQERLTKLEHWHHRASSLAPMLGKFLD